MSYSKNPANNRSYASKGRKRRSKNQQNRLEVPDQRREVKLYGINAVKACIQNRPKDVIRLYVTQRNVSIFKEFLSRMATEKKTYHIVTMDELAKISGTEHHEGVCALVRSRPPIKLSEVLEKIQHSPDTRQLFVALAGVGNPHNIGAIARSACHFGINGLIVEGDEKKFTWSAASARVAEGALEHLPFCVVEDLKAALEEMKDAGFKIVAAEAKGDASLFGFFFPKHTVFVLGAEGTGVPNEIASSADHSVRIDGTSKIESLNVASAASVIFAEWWRHQI